MKWMIHPPIWVPGMGAPDDPTFIWEPYPVEAETEDEALMGLGNCRAFPVQEGE
jgi:hypothetical protein